MTDATVDVEAGTSPHYFASTNDDDETTKRNAIAAFVLTGTRRAKRLALYGGKGVRHVASKIGDGVKAALPLIGFLVGLSFVAAGFGAMFGLAGYALNLAFMLHPAVGWTIVGFVAITTLRAAVALVRSLLDTPQPLAV